MRTAERRLKRGSLHVQLHVRMIDGPLAGRTLAVRPPISHELAWGAVTYRVDRDAGGLYAMLDRSGDPHTPIVAWRAYTVDHSVLDRPVLRSGHDAIWPQGGPLQATCKANTNRGADPTEEEPPHDAPQLDCGCGIYATRTLHHLRTAGYGDPQLFGLIALWGRVIEHDDGYRARYAYPLALLVNLRDTSLDWGEWRPADWRDATADLCRSIARQYRVPVGACPPAKAVDQFLRLISRGGLEPWVASAVPPDIAMRRATLVG